jgi:DNA-binding FadR family transcriptional regulator
MNKHSGSSSDFLDYLVDSRDIVTPNDRLPSLNSLSKELGLSVSTLREQMEVARMLGLVEAKPRIGLRRKPYTFTPAVSSSLSYAIALDSEYFNQFADLRKKIETAYWHEAVRLLTLQDRKSLTQLIDLAWQKLRGSPIQIPQLEHRELHLIIYRRLGNSFVQGILEAYWDAYEAIGLNLYADYKYLEEVWEYHQRMVDAINREDYDAGYNALLVHTDLIRLRAIPTDGGGILITKGE